MPVFRRRRGHPLLNAFNNAAQGPYFSDDDLQDAYYFDDSLTERYVTGDA